MLGWLHGLVTGRLMRNLQLCFLGRSNTRIQDGRHVAAWASVSVAVPWDRPVFAHGPQLWGARKCPERGLELGLICAMGTQMRAAMEKHGAAQILPPVEEALGLADRMMRGSGHQLDSHRSEALASIMGPLEDALKGMSRSGSRPSPLGRWGGLPVSRLFFCLPGLLLACLLAQDDSPNIAACEQSGLLLSPHQLCVVAGNSPLMSHAARCLGGSERTCVWPTSKQRAACSQGTGGHPSGAAP